MTGDINGIEALVICLVVYGVRDGILAWWLIHRLLASGSAPQQPATTGTARAPPAPGRTEPAAGGVPEPVSPPPAPAALAKPSHTGITATSFAGGNDSTFSRTSAYDGKIINGDTELAVALPARVQAGRLVRVFYNGRNVDAAIRDVGPWNTKDPYWTTGARPQAETGTDTTGRKTNRAGIDLSPAVWKALGYAGDPRNATDKVDWDFVDALGASTPATVSPTPASSSDATVPPWLVLIRKLRDMGIHATHDNAIIMQWPGAIAAKFPEMADYCKGYVHDSTPWCGLTIAFAMASSGIKPQFGPTDTDRFLWANSWAQFGTGVTEPQPGDILVFRWAGGGHHVTLYDHEENDNFYHCTGGNQGNGHVISTEAMPMANCIAIRRPPPAA